MKRIEAEAMYSSETAPYSWYKVTLMRDDSLEIPYQWIHGNEVIKGFSSYGKAIQFAWVEWQDKKNIHIYPVYYYPCIVCGGETECEVREKSTMPTCSSRCQIEAAYQGLILF